MREQARGISAETVRFADELATEVISILDRRDEPEDAVARMGRMIELAERYRASRIRDNSDAMAQRAADRAGGPEAVHRLALPTVEVHRTGSLSNATVSDMRAGDARLEAYGLAGVEIEVEANRMAGDTPFVEMLDSLELGDRVIVTLEVGQRVAEVEHLHPDSGIRHAHVDADRLHDEPECPTCASTNRLARSFERDGRTPCADPWHDRPTVEDGTYRTPLTERPFA